MPLVPGALHAARAIGSASHRLVSDVAETPQSNAEASPPSLRRDRQAALPHPGPGSVLGLETRPLQPVAAQVDAGRQAVVVAFAQRRSGVSPAPHNRISSAPTSSPARLEGQRLQGQPLAAHQHDQAGLDQAVAPGRQGAMPGWPRLDRVRPRPRGPGTG